MQKTTMGISPMVHAITAIIIIGTNLLICITADTDNMPKLTSRTTFFTKRKMAEDDDSNVLPLPYEIFTKEISDLLSPDMFLQTDPISYLLAKVKKFPEGAQRRINVKLRFKLPSHELPRRYFPYVDILSALITGIIQLEGMKTIIPLLQREPTAESNYLRKQLDMSIIEPELSPLFSSYVFSDKNPPFRIFGKLVEIPEKDISYVKIQLQNLMKNRKFPRRYFRYTKCLLAFLEQHNVLQRLKTNAAKIRLAQIKNPTALIHTTINDVCNDDESNSDISETEQSPNNSLFKTNPPKIPLRFRSEVVAFLSPDMFSQTNPVAYFLDKAAKEYKDYIRSMQHHLSYYLEQEAFPQQYIPYAELASSVLLCLIGLDSVDVDIRRIRSDLRRTHEEIKTDISILDPDLSILFSPEIILKAPRPSIKVLEILITIPEDEISEVVTRLKELGEDNRFPNQYMGYNANIWKFLDLNTQTLLRLQDDIDEVERVLALHPSTLVNNEIPPLTSL